jgi:5-methylcytosine-specific restriction endonuclease McrA
VTDHIIPLAKGGEAHSIDNLQPLCLSCHIDKSNADKGHRVKPRIGLDGWPEE